MYEIEISPPALKFLERLRRSRPRIADRIKNVIDSLAQCPLQGKKMLGGLSRLRSLRVGEYQILYMIIARRVIVQAVKIGHRWEIYR